MYRGPDRSLLVRLLKPAIWTSLTCALAMLAVGMFTWNLAGTTGRALLASSAVLAGSAVMLLLTRCRAKAGPAGAAAFAAAIATTAISTAAFLWLVWAGFADRPGLWRLWWLMLIPSALAGLTALLQIVGQRRGGAVETAVDALAVWAAIMLLWPGLRADMFAGLSGAYWWTFAFPAFCASAGTLYILARRALGAPRPGQASKAGAVALLLLTHLAAAVTAYNAAKSACAEQQPASRDAGHR